MTDKLIKQLTRIVDALYSNGCSTMGQKVNDAIIKIEDQEIELDNLYRERAFGNRLGKEDE